MFYNIYKVYIVYNKNLLITKKYFIIFYFILLFFLFFILLFLFCFIFWSGKLIFDPKTVFTRRRIQELTSLPFGVDRLPLPFHAGVSSR